MERYQGQRQTQEASEFAEWKYGTPRRPRRKVCPGAPVKVKRKLTRHFELDDIGRSIKNLSEEF